MAAGPRGPLARRAKRGDLPARSPFGEAGGRFSEAYVFFIMDSLLILVREYQRVSYLSMKCWLFFSLLDCLQFREFKIQERVEKPKFFQADQKCPEASCVLRNPAHRGGPCLCPAMGGYAQAGKIPCRERIYAFPTVLALTG